MSTTEDLAAESALFPGEPESITIAGKTIPVLGLNLHGIKTVVGATAKIVEPITKGYRDYMDARDAYLAAKLAPEEGETAVAPSSTWWLPAILESLEDVMFAVHVILERADPSVTLSWLKENMVPMRDLQVLIPMIGRANAIEGLLKNVLESEITKTLIRSQKSKTPFALNLSSSSSSESTESRSTTSPDDTADTPSPSASSSATESPTSSD